jgi:hypothetical protein
MLPSFLPSGFHSRLPSRLRASRASGRPFEAQGKQGEQGKQFKVEEGKIRRAKRPEPLGVNADTLA